MGNGGFCSASLPRALTSGPAGKLASNLMNLCEQLFQAVRDAVPLTFARRGS
jgi:hypothetical protein